ncbi:MAG TPA: hypothetical protein PL061_13560, partial [Syntrophales bacterium]|nr:hypothetical protein [Syntrophales bacterium]
SVSQGNLYRCQAAFTRRRGVREELSCLALLCLKTLTDLLLVTVVGIVMVIAPLSAFLRGKK